jgi:hypothetical protein
MSAHSIPIASIRIGRKLGHWKLSPVAEPTLRKTPKPGFVLNVPSPRNAKFRASPLSSTEPIFTFAPTDPNETSSSLSAAPVSSMKSRAVSVT